MIEKKRKPIGTRAFRAAWKKSTKHMTDTWGVRYAYEFNAWELWKAAVKHGRETRRSVPTTEGRTP